MEVMTAFKVCLIVYAIGAVISMLVAGMISLIYKVIKGTEKSAAKGA